VWRGTCPETAYVVAYQNENGIQVAQNLSDLGSDLDESV
jgi:hypothetical protein